MKTTIKTAPTDEPITELEAFRQLRLIAGDEAPAAHQDYSYVQGLITTARRQVEAITNRALMTQTWEMWLDRWPKENAIEIPFPPLQSLTALTYTDVDATGYSLTEGTEITVDTDSAPGRIVLEYDETWPTEQLHPNNPIKIEFVAGYADAAAVPAEIKHAIKLMVSHWYDNRLPAGVNDLAILPIGIDDLLASYRVWSF